MANDRTKSRTLRRVPRRSPGGKVKLHLKKRKPRKARCGACGMTLPGVARGRPYQVKKQSKSQKRPERPFGGTLCTKCTKRAMIIKARTAKKAAA